MEFSKRQEDIFKIWKEQDVNLVINAVAGSGKTTTLLELIKRSKHKVLYLAFNRTVKLETQEKIDKMGLKQGKALTLHSLGLRAINKAFNHKVVVNKGKNFELIKKFQNKRAISKRLKWMNWDDKLRLSYNMMDMNDVSRLFMTDDFNEILECCDTIGKTILLDKYTEEYWEILKELRRLSYKGDKVEIDFTDMLYLPAVEKLPIPIDPIYLMIDEAQDLSVCQHALIDQLLSQGTVEKWIAVGDRNQAIYGFSGASNNSLKLFTDRPNTVEAPLDICYRCDTEIVDVANEVYDVMQAHSTKEGIVDEVTNISDIKEGSMVICRNTNPIIALYFALLSERKACTIKGEDILSSINKFLKPYAGLMIQSARDKMASKMMELSTDTTERGQMNYYFFKQNYENFERLVIGLNILPKTLIKFMLEDIKKIFEKKDDKDVITLCTIHKSKGLEADVVYILQENLIPSKFARSPEQLQQEENLRYVARTRAKHELYFLNPV